jgi:hypothetical protein
MEKKKQLQDCQDEETSCVYRVLREIRAVLDDQSLDDPTCFWKIEKIVCLFEEMGWGGGSRHDF